MSKKSTPATTAVQTSQAQATTAPSGSHIDDSEFFINTPIRTNLTDEACEAWYKSRLELPTHLDGIPLPEEFREDFVGVSGAQVCTAKPVPVVLNTALSDFATLDDDDFGRDDVSQDPIVSLTDCNNWLQLTYAPELAALAKLGAHVEARAVCASSRRRTDSFTLVLLTVKDGLVGGEAGADGQMTFTFWDVDQPKVELGELTMPQFQDMARLFWEKLPLIKDVYQARAAYIAATDDSPAHTMPDVEYQAARDSQEDAIKYQWFTGETLPKTDETQNHYSLSRLVALVDTYGQWADVGV